MSARRLLSVFLLFLAPAAAQTLRVAVAADFGPAMKKLVAEYEKKSPVKIEIITGSSGNFFAQIQNGAPFDLFFSADSEYPAKLVSDGKADGETLKTYAIGRLAMWTSNPEMRAKGSINGFWVDEAWCKKIAIANPEHAPYGRAAMETLKSLGVYEKVKNKLVFGESVAQAAQFAESGNADVAIVSASLIVSSPMLKNGVTVLLQGNSPPIVQSAVIVSASKRKAAAQAFLDFVIGDDGREIIRYQGFTLP